MNSFDDILNHSPAPQQTEGGRLPKEEFIEKKRAEREAVYALADNTATDAVSDGGKFQAYLDVQGKFGGYSVVNAMLILAQKPSATRIGDFEHWKELECSVKGGQTAFSIIEPGGEYQREDGTTGISYNVKKVFDISQVDTRNLKASPKPARSERQLLSALVKGAPVRISSTDTLPDGLGAQYDTQTDTILVRKDMGFADTFRVLAHELCYTELTGGTKTQANPHFSAYCAAYLLCEKYGLETRGFDFAAAPDVFADMDAQRIKGELTQIRDAASDISGRMAKQLDAVKAARTQEVR